MRRALYMVVVACATDQSAPNPPDPDPDPGAEPEAFEIAMSVPIGPGEERHWCRYVLMPEGGVDVSRFEHRYTEGSHHLLLFETTLTVEEARGSLEPFDCFDREDLRATGVIYGSQEPRGTVPYPPGVAFRIPEDMVVLLQSHYLNTSDQTVDADVRVTLWPIEGAVEHFAGSFFFYDPFIVIPGGGTFTARQRCVLPQTVTVLGAAPHMHKRGTAFRSWRLGDGDSREEMHMSGDWTELEPTVFGQGFTVKAGDAIEYECDYQNDRDTPVTQGPSAEANEMCAFGGIYYPRLDVEAERCMNAGSGPILEGTRTCMESVACAGAAPGDEAAMQSCFLDACPGSRDAVNALVWCTFLHGIDACGREYDACAAATCE